MTQSSKIGPITITTAIATVVVNGAANHEDAVQAAAIGKIVVNGTALTVLPAVFDTGNTAGMDEATDTIVRII